MLRLKGGPLDEDRYEEEPEEREELLDEVGVPGMGSGDLVRLPRGAGTCSFGREAAICACVGGGWGAGAWAWVDGQ